jgi:pantoate--beta-alanine ligase
VNVLRTRAEVRSGSVALRAHGARLGLVPTMGALHAGHRELIRRAVAGNDAVLVSIFVNPLQFGTGEDLDRYPRTMEADLALCEREGVAAIFAPDRATMYPGGTPGTTIDPGPLGVVLEGQVRPGHFAGVLTVVAKLFHLVAPGAAYFGEKDYQQLTLIRAMARDLDFDLDVVGCPTVREPDGLALSSRNAYLSAVDRDRALTLSRALFAGASSAADGGPAVLKRAGEVLAAGPGGLPAVDTDYLELRDPDFGPAPQRGAARLLVAARVGPTRLIDNIPVRLGEE